MLAQVERVAPTETPVMITGEPGTGKELVAKALHDLSGRAGGPFVPVDCAALDEWRFDREVFGVEDREQGGEGAATGGLIRAAEGGTLFLDEVWILSPGSQAKLLRLLDTHIFRPEEGSWPVKADFRLICSSERDLRELVAKGRFRNDLYLRLGSFPVEVPPLRNRPEDIPLLVDSLLWRLESQRECRRVDPGVIEVLQRYTFPGNVRELSSILERACVLADGDTIKPEHLPPDLLKRRLERRGSLSFSGDVVPLADVELLYIDWAVKNYPWTQRELAHELEISERTLYRRLQRFEERSERLKRSAVAISPLGDLKFPH